MVQKWEDMKEEFEGHNLIPSNDVAQIKIKLGKSHRKESDWEYIKKLLSEHDVLLAAPKKDDYDIEEVEHMSLRGDSLFVFTNLDDCVRFISEVNFQDGKMDREFDLGTRPFEQCVDISNETEYGL